MTVGTRQLRIGFRGRELRSIPDLNLQPGHVWLVTGPNGSGKTTLLKTLAGLLPAVAGTVAPHPHRGTGGAVFVHSVPVLFRGSVRHNLEIPGANGAAIAEVAAKFGLQSHLDTHVHELSHGLRQRVSLARAILARPGFLLLDEPEGGLDDAALQLWRGFAEDAVRNPELTLVVAAHRPAGLEDVPTRVIALE